MNQLLQKTPLLDAQMRSSRIQVVMGHREFFLGALKQPARRASIATERARDKGIAPERATGACNNNTARVLHCLLCWPTLSVEQLFRNGSSSNTMFHG